MQLKIIPTGAFATNCYLVFQEKKSELLIIDPGDDADLIIQCAESFHPLTVRILLTHAHIDHFSATVGVADKFDIAAVEMSLEDMLLYNSRENAIPPYYPGVDNLPSASKFSPVDNCQIIELPGHTPGGRGFLFSDETMNFLLSGDTLFAGSIGRTDLPGGDQRMLLKSIKDKLLVLPDNLKVYPGHGSATTIGNEKKHNPYIQ